MAYTSSSRIQSRDRRWMHKRTEAQASPADRSTRVHRIRARLTPAHFGLDSSFGFRVSRCRVLALSLALCTSSLRQRRIVLWLSPFGLSADSSLTRHSGFGSRTSRRLVLALSLVLGVGLSSNDAGRNPAHVIHARRIVPLRLPKVPCGACLLPCRDSADAPPTSGRGAGAGQVVGNRTTSSQIL